MLYFAAFAGGVALASLEWMGVFGGVAWLVSAYLWPFAPCMACGGARRNPGSSRKRFGRCKMCGGAGERQVLGSKTVHKAVRSLVKSRGGWGK